MEENCHDHKTDRWSHGGGAQKPAIEDDMATPQGALDRDKMAVWHLNKCGSSTKEKEDGATIMKDVPRN
ncbi:unnamed protein product [Nippostrongylus brasiliensis]|uniref:Uncharacterized protein n=1 Tax=Nippostrongylus brasiliensis TaxID=27835 RepID=A0A0N4YU72_NIPBR|nr:unnamed protein product [Nippostrongylus brasiliensis]